jgi:hypothetical protein
MALFLITACAEDGAGAAVTAEPVVAREEAGSAGATSSNIMDQPVDFSTPENVDKSLQKIREQDGDKAFTRLDAAMQYILYYDLSLGGNKENMYKKLDGQTPNQIIAKMKR